MTLWVIRHMKMVMLLASCKNKFLFIFSWVTLGQLFHNYLALLFNFALDLNRLHLTVKEKVDWNLLKRVYFYSAKADYQFSNTQVRWNKINSLLWLDTIDHELRLTRDFYNKNKFLWNIVMHHRCVQFIFYAKSQIFL